VWVVIINNKQQEQLLMESTREGEAAGLLAAPRRGVVHVLPDRVWLTAAVVCPLLE